MDKALNLAGLVIFGFSCAMLARFIEIESHPSVDFPFDIRIATKSCRPPCTCPDAKRWAEAHQEAVV